MRILLVFPFLPYPPDDGGRIGFFNPIKYLSRKHEVTVACLVDGTERDASIEELRKVCADLRTCRRAKYQDPLHLLKGAIFSPPGASAKYWHGAMGELIRQVIAERNPDIVEFHHLNTAIYRKFAGDVPVVLREHNVEYKVWERFAENSRGWTQSGYARWNAPRVKRYEAEVASQFDRCVMVSPADAAHLQNVSLTSKIEVIPSGVDTEYFHPMPEVEEEPWSMTLTGSFEWKPKQESLLSLLTNVFPKIKEKISEARLYVVGKGVPKQLRRMADKMVGVTIVGTVPDVRPYIARSALLINYLESGGGIALKVLEAMAMRKPVLSNSLGCEGIEVEHGREVYLADGPHQFAEAAVHLLWDQTARRGLADRGHCKVLKSYSWTVAAHRFQDLYQKVLEEHGKCDPALKVLHAFPQQTGPHGVPSNHE